MIALAFWLEKVQCPPKGSPRPRIRHWWWGVFGPIAMMGVVAALILKEPDLGSALLLGVVTLVLMFLAGAPAAWLAALVGTGSSVIAALLTAILKVMGADLAVVARSAPVWRRRLIEPIHGFVFSKGVYTTLDFPNDGGVRKL